MPVETLLNYSVWLSNHIYKSVVSKFQPKMINVSVVLCIARVSLLHFLVSADTILANFFFFTFFAISCISLRRHNHLIEVIRCFAEPWDWSRMTANWEIISLSSRGNSMYLHPSLNSLLTSDRFILGMPWIYVHSCSHQISDQLPCPCWVEAPPSGFQKTENRTSPPELPCAACFPSTSELGIVFW